MGYLALLSSEAEGDESARGKMPTAVMNWITAATAPTILTTSEPVQ